MRISDWSSDVCSSDLSAQYSRGGDRAHRGRNRLWRAAGQPVEGRCGGGGTLLRGGRDPAGGQWPTRSGRAGCRAEFGHAMIDPHLQHVPRLGRHPSRFRLAGTPVITVMLGSLATTLPVIAQSPVMPPFGLLLLLRSEEHTSELQSLMRISYAVFCLIQK